MPIVAEAKPAKPARERRAWIVAAATIALLALPLLPMLTPARFIRLAGYTFAAEFEQGPAHDTDGLTGATARRDRGAFVCHVWFGRVCYRGVWLTPDGNTKWLL